jgi:hypothetical protein
MHVLVTRRVKANGKVIKHAYGPYAHRKDAESDRKRIIRRFPNIEISVLKVTGGGRLRWEWQRVADIS